MKNWDFFYPLSFFKKNSALQIYLPFNKSDCKCVKKKIDAQEVLRGGGSRLLRHGLLTCTTSETILSSDAKKGKFP
jgi:hypothetical protein